MNIAQKFNKAIENSPQNAEAVDKFLDVVVDV